MLRFPKAGASVYTVLAQLYAHQSGANAQQLLPLSTAYRCHDLGLSPTKSAGARSAASLEQEVLQSGFGVNFLNLAQF